jgi:hypothetical protein
MENIILLAVIYLASSTLIYGTAAAYKLREPFRPYGEGCRARLDALFLALIGGLLGPFGILLTAYFFYWWKYGIKF